MLEQQDIQNMLIELGASTHLKGFEYIVDAVQRYNPAMSMTRELYPQIAKQFQSTPHRVERAIRTLVEYIFKRMDSDEIFKTFGNVPSPKNGKLTNSEFISLISLRLNQQQNAKKYNLSVFPTG